MAGEIFIEAREVEIIGLPTGAEHLYLVFRDINGEEYVIRSGPENRWQPWRGDMRIEANVRMEDSSDDRGDDTPAERRSTPLDFAGLTDDQAWAIMVRYARMIEDEDYPYEVFDENSNAFIGAMLAAAGGDPGAMLPRGVDEDDAIGFDNYREILDDVPPPPDGTVYGTAGSDRITGIQIDEVIVALAGHDTVWGGRGSDRIHGADGNDLMLGQQGRDSLYGGNGADTLDGGIGWNALTGGAGADIFRFTQASTGRINDFQNGVDRIRIWDDAPFAFEELSISSFGTTGQHTRIVHEAWVIEVMNVRRALIDASDLDLLVA